MSLDAFPRGVLVPAVTTFNADLSVDAERSKAADSVSVSQLHPCGGRT